MKTLENKWVQLGLRLALGGVFIYAGVLKIAAPQAFADSIATFRLLPVAGVNLVALGLPILEVFLGVLVIIGFQLRAGAFGLGLLSAIFAAAIIQGLARGLEIDCGCFGSGAPSVAQTWLTLGRDVVLVAAAFSIYHKAAREIADRSEMDSTAEQRLRRPTSQTTVDA